MGRSPCCDGNTELKKGPWTPDEDEKLVSYVQKHGHGSWRALPKLAGLNRCGKSCRLRWTNYLRPDIKRGCFSEEEEQLIIKLHSILGNKWSRIATHLPGRTDNEIKNYWNTQVRKKLMQMGIDPITHKPRTDLNFFANLSQLFYTPHFTPTLTNNPWEKTTQLAKFQILQNILQILNTSALPIVEQTTPLGVQTFNHLEASINSLNGTTAMNNITGVLGEAPNYIGLSQTRSETQNYGISDSWASYESGHSTKVLDTNNQNSLSSSPYNTPKENTLPALVSISPETSIVNPIESYTNSTNGSPADDFFEAWEKLMDDGTSDSFWSDLLN
ncbi:hypothetical protein Nepgr_011045 [Nepenthes gracilis]|uniref:Uncharacterized protein n=1 Tax=Nepenthes gracilis TaxID=150966 RepID=A0AAD3SEE0_NEPGR|nr:hypothetical protein Nepgr_011045 [Nepenthes gracilis]